MRIPGDADSSNDRARLFRDRSEITRRLARLWDPHVEPLNRWVERLRQQLGPEAIVPWFDPADGGVQARILWLVEAPGPKATDERGGSGFISCNNNDTTAANTFRARTEAGIDRSLVIHWNAIPYYIGDDRKIRGHNQDDIRAVGALLREFLAMVPNLQVVILAGAAAQRTWSAHASDMRYLTVLRCPHPSPTNVNTRPDVWGKVRDAWKQAAEIINSSGVDVPRPQHRRPTAGTRRMAVIPPTTYQNPRDDDPWDNDTYCWLAERGPYTRFEIGECLRQQKARLTKQPSLVRKIERFAETHGVHWAEEECLGKKIFRAYRTDSAAPSYPSPVGREEWYRARRRHKP